eukprot:220529_1
MFTMLSWMLLVTFYNTIYSQRTTKPNILFILVDDLGWANVGYHQPQNHEIRTPNIDYLATKVGLRLNRHLVHYTCSPTRSSLQSGRIPYHVNLINENVVNNKLGGVPINMTCIASKLTNVNYDSHFIGKWDAGSATFEQLPINRGYKTSFGYLGHSNSYWDQREGGNPCLEYDVPNIIDLWMNQEPAYNQNGKMYEEFMFSQRVYNLLDNATQNPNPFFIVYAPHIGHSPLQIPKEYLLTFENDEYLCQDNKVLHPVYPGYNGTYHCRSMYQSMINLLDVIIGNITNKLKQNNLWNDTLIVLSADNGGELLLSCCGANNYPLRGGKFTPFEGGVRGVAFVSGGYLPSSRYGEIENGLIVIADWYTTFCSILGIDITDENAIKAGLPAVDGLNMWPLISGQNLTSPRTEMIVDNNTLVMGSYKYITDDVVNYATWTSELFPNSSSILHPIDGTFLNCRRGCLFDLKNDTSEHLNIIDLNEETKQIAQNMNKRLMELRETFYTNNQSAVDVCSSNVTIPCCCWIAKNKYDKFYGPYQVPV